MKKNEKEKTNQVANIDISLTQRSLDIGINTHTPLILSSFPHKTSTLVRVVTRQELRTRTTKCHKHPFILQFHVFRLHEMHIWPLVLLLWSRQTIVKKEASLQSFKESLLHATNKTRHFINTWQTPDHASVIYIFLSVFFSSPFYAQTTIMRWHYYDINSTFIISK